MSAVVRALQENVKNKSARKFQKNQINNQRDRRLQKHEGALERAHPLARRGQGGGLLVRWGLPSPPPFGIYLHPKVRTLAENPVTRFRPLFRRRRDSDLGIAKRSCPSTLQEGGLTSAN